MTLTNTRIKYAIQRLIRQYIKEEHTGNVNSCPLCCAVRTKEFFDINDCTRCPNMAFATRVPKNMCQLPCNDRGNRFKNLDFSEYNDARLAIFWKEVYDIMPSGRKSFEMTDDLKKQILKIARSVNRRKL